MDFWHRKKSAFQKLVKSDPVMKSCASAFILPNKSQEDISELGKDLMVDLFGNTHVGYGMLLQGKLGEVFQG